MLPGGDKLFKLIKNAIGDEFSEKSKKNNKNLKFKELWTVPSECRHTITHSNLNIDKSKIKITDYHFEIFNHLFYADSVNDAKIKIRLGYKKLERLLKYVAEFGYQMFKLLSQPDNYPYQLKG